ncbi:MAG: hypothetical protein IH946_09325 [Bacteroidetes bacterium]|nr:hypothetical protein [Bacteroidota bacterium]
MFYRAVAGEPAFNILFEGDSTKPDIVIIYKNSEGMGSAGAMVTGVLWLIERQIIKLELVDFKFNIDALQKAELSVLKLRNLGFTPEDLIEAGYPLDELLEDFAISRLKKAGFTAFDFKALGFSKYNLQVSGFNSEELKEAGY